jgi:ABC-type enterochelin transport system permease subunit
VAAGLAAVWLRSHRPALIAAGTAVPSAILLGEGFYGLTVVLATTGPVVWILELVAGIAFIVLVCVRRLRSGRAIALCVGLSLLGAAAFDATFRLI